MNLNNGEIFDYEKARVLTELSKCTYLYRSAEKTNYLKTTYKQENILAFKFTEENEKVDLIIQIPSEFECYHYFKGKTTQKTISTPRTHLTYHGCSKKKKQSGEIHLVVDDTITLKGKSNVLEAPLAFSDDIYKFPLPICRFEFCSNISSIEINELIPNYFEILGQECFFNTIDVYLAKAGFITNSLNGLLTIPEIAFSIFAHTNLEGFKISKIIRRRGRYPQVLVLQIKNYELIIVNIEEAHNKFYVYNRLYYFHSRNYLKTLFNRNAKKVGEGYFIDLEDGYPDKGDGYFKIKNII
ncbi:MAG: hypothetical protein M0P61_06280 [Ignavibacteriaceae bacterium]|jgi:hypothetical protein|nr:hypothetical protein [Ignavibacteriaceae bacterium]